ncbi:hypothetical protein SmJEL517_g01465 [Synchytrium microbalum]|uniref:RRM domain-containing protein n=1 Tax=Synchytrium microbalum TaxID=1806994 RepID=A0A507CFG6_9FUNG|nr:uncharacterized protein SmJEL517_g01465 [Synchytrium microbalum]TPX36253.1 hypothetical protein SmJEL517_g01465 [Synchytrium microbalum]
MAKRKRNQAAAKPAEKPWWDQEEDDEPVAANVEPQNPTKPTTNTDTSSTTISSFASFKVLTIQMPPLLTSTKQIPITNHHLPSTINPIPVTHHLFLKRHETRKANNNSNPKPSNDEEWPVNRTLFVANVPIDATKLHFETLFKGCGSVQDVFFHREKSGGNSLARTAHVVFEDEDGVDCALELKAGQARIWVSADTNADSDEEDSNELLGIPKWQAEQSILYPPLPDLLSRVTHELAIFEQAEKDAREAARNKRNVPDADGFITVTRASKRKTATDGSGATVTAAKAEEVKNLKPKKRELLDFYRFQIKEKKMNQLTELRKKFEQDKERITALKNTRKFKPY